MGVVEKLLEKALENQNRRVADLEAELSEIKGAMERQGLGLMRTSQGPVGTMICHSMEAEARIFQKENELINQVIDLQIKLKKAEEKPATILKAISDRIREESETDGLRGGQGMFASWYILDIIEETVKEFEVGKTKPDQEQLEYPDDHHDAQEN